MRGIKYISFENARKYVHSQKLKSSKYWTIYCKSGKKPDNIPAYPQSVYKKEWKGMGDWLGTERIPNADLYESGFYLPFEKARKFARSLNLKTENEWKHYRSKKPKNIPGKPQVVYKNKGWVSCVYWRATEKFANQNSKNRE